MSSPIALESPRRPIRSLDAILEVFASPPPRTLPADLRRRAISPIANFLILMGLFETVFVLAMGALVASQPGRGNAITLAILLPCALAFIAVGGVHRVHIARLLAQGRLTRGRIVKVRPLPARINSRTFCRVVCSLVGPSGSEVTAVDTVDNWSVEWCLAARDAAEEIDLLYTPSVPRRVILPRRLATEARFD